MAKSVTPPEPQPDVEDGIEYWNTQPASYDGVLGELHHLGMPQ